jgi:hypothetical protein
MLSPLTSPTAQTAMVAAGRGVRTGFRASSDQGSATCAGHDPSETGALGCG